jgi:hypothetical protein
MCVKQGVRGEVMAGVRCDASHGRCGDAMPMRWVGPYSLRTTSVPNSHLPHAASIPPHVQVTVVPLLLLASHYVVALLPHLPNAAIIASSNSLRWLASGCGVDTSAVGGP